MSVSEQLLKMKGVFNIPVESFDRDSFEKHRREFYEQRMVDVTNRPIGEKLHTFANEVSMEILELERAKSELDSIRATLLVNIERQTLPYMKTDNRTTLSIMIEVLEKLTGNDKPLRNAVNV